MVRKAAVLSTIGLVSLVLLSCGDPHDPGITVGPNRIDQMKPRAFIAMTAMHALLETHPEMEDGELARRAFEIADALITEAEKPGNTERE